MTRRPWIVTTFAWVALAAAAQAQDLTRPVVAPVPLPWKVNCHGMANIPLTSDALQSLPLKLVANLSCDQGLALVSDPSGYTVNVRTADGKTGYVASMYLMKAPPAKPAPRIEPTAASTNNGVARWRPGAKGCDQFTRNGAVVESLTANGVTVQVSLAEAGSRLRADVAVGNFGNTHVYVNPIGIELESKGAHGRSLTYRDPAQLAKETLRGGNGARNAAFRNAEFSPVFASAYSDPGDHVEDLSKPQLNHTAMVPDEFSSQALKKGTLKPDARTWGAVWFERDETSSQFVMRVPIDNQVFEFPLSLETTYTLNDSANQ
jgi:hypothetical protein